MAMKKNIYTQNDLRRLMLDHKSKSVKQSGITKKENRIDSPLAKYDEKNDTLSCILCRTVVKVWKVHINSKNHREKVEIAKKFKDNLCLPKEPSKRANETSTTNSPSEKKLKIDDGDQKRVPSDFFDDLDKNVLSNESINVMDTDEKIDNPLPEGFFDDPKKDAKVRNIDYKDPQEKEWLQFQREIKDETSISLEIIAGEVETSTNDRQIQDIDEQMYNWQRVLNMEKKKDHISEKIRSKPIKDEHEGSDDRSSEEEDFDDFLDWRAKQIIKK
ncbi:ZNF830 family protein [Megaselia abdita]